MPTLEQARQLQEFAEEIFELSKNIWASQSRDKDKHESEISETEFLALDTLSKHQPMTVGDIQKEIGVLPAQMSRIIRSLESKGESALISCQINPNDKRKIDVELTAAGRKAHQGYRERKLASTRQVLMALGDEDRQEFMRLLRIIRDAGRKAMPE